MAEKTLETKEKAVQSGGEIFFNKLKEQSFTIMLLVGILYYQNTIFTAQLDEYKKMIAEKDALVLKLAEEERARLIERLNHVSEQRDKFVDELINERKTAANGK